MGIAAVLPIQKDKTPIPASWVDVAYVAGVVNGDGWINKAAIGLRVKDEDFAREFARALRSISGRQIGICFVRNRYYEVRTGNRGGLFNFIADYKPVHRREISAWLRGMFDSEGHASNRRLPGKENSFTRQVSIFNTDKSLLLAVDDFLQELGMETRGLQRQGTGRGHKGSKQVYVVHLRCSRENYARFRDYVGSSISRKRRALQDIVKFYVADKPKALRKAQAKGVKARNEKRDLLVIPGVINEIRRRLESGLSVSQVDCRKNVTSYHSAWNRYGHHRLIKLARNGL